MKLNKTNIPTWDELLAIPVPEWYRDSKLGIYMHWGVYSVPAFSTGRASSDKYSMAMYTPLPNEKRFAGIHEYHLAQYGDPHKFGYKDFVPLWKAEKWDPDYWADLFLESGAQFVGINAEHHDSFPLWNSQYSEWNAARMGPKRDIVSELEKCIRIRGLRLFISLHNVRNWRWYEHAYGHRPPFDIEDKQYAKIGGIYPPPHHPGENLSNEYVKFWRNKVREIIDRFCPDYLWLDACLNELPDEVRRWFLGYYYSAAQMKNREVIVNNKRGLQFPPGIGVYNLEGHELEFDEIQDKPWDTDAQILRSQWAYTANDPVKSFSELLEYFINVVCMGGNLILNISPMADGTIPEDQQDRLRRLGKWLAIFGEAVFETRPWKIHRLGESVRFTQSKDGRIIYGFHKGSFPQQLELSMLPANQNMKVDLLENKCPLQWSLSENGGMIIEFFNNTESYVKISEDTPIQVFRITL